MSGRMASRSAVVRLPDGKGWEERLAAAVDEAVARLSAGGDPVHVAFAPIARSDLYGGEANAPTAAVLVTVLLR